MNTSNLIDLLATRIGTIPNMPTLAKENTNFKPTLLKPWMRMTVIPGEPTQLSIGEDRLMRYTGLVQIDVFTPPNTGNSTASETLIAYFNNKANRMLTLNGEPLHISKAYRGTSQHNTDWFRVPVILRYEYTTF